MRDTIKILGLDELKQAFARLDAAAAGEMLLRAANAGAQPVLRSAKARVRKRTRTLSRSIHVETAESRKDFVEVWVGTDLEYAAIHEFGGTIKPKTAKYLSIPLTQDARRFAGGPRDFRGGLHVRMRKGADRGVLVDDQGTAQYALVKSVTITAQPYLRPALDARANDAKAEMGTVLGELIGKAVPDAE